MNMNTAHRKQNMTSVSAAMTDDAIRSYRRTPRTDCLACVSFCSCCTAWLDSPCVFFCFFQAEDGIRDLIVTGVQTCVFFFSSRRRHTRSDRDWSSDVCSSDLRSTSFSASGEVHIATDDGSRGFAGFVPALAEKLVDRDKFDQILT